MLQLLEGIKSADVQVVQSLVGAGVTFDGDLTFAITRGNCDIVKVTADSQPERNNWGYLSGVAVFEGGKRAVVQLLLQYGIEKQIPALFDHDQLIQATRDSRVGIMTDLLEAGADPSPWYDEEDGTPLHVSCGKEPGVMECLLEYGADEEADQDFGRRPIHVAAIGGHVTSIDLLCRYGADIESETQAGETALHEAAFWSKPDSVKALTDNGANVNAQMDNGDTPLHVVARMAGFSCEKSELIATREVMDALLLAGADETIVNDRGRAPRNVVGQWSIRHNGWGDREEPVWGGCSRPILRQTEKVPADRAWSRRGVLVLFRVKNYLDREADTLGVPAASAWTGKQGWAAGMGWALS